MSESNPSRALVEEAGERDASGRFLPGNSTSRRGGNPRLKALAAAQQAIRDACSPEQVVEVLEALRTQAMNGDVAAGIAWLTRILGRPREEAPEVCIDLPAIVDASSLAEGLRTVAGAAADGTIPLDAGERLAALLSHVGEALVVRELSERLDALERGSR